MALMHGKQGNVQWDAGVARQTLAYVQSWSVDVTLDVEEITSMQDTWRSYLGGFRDWTATVTTLLPDDGTNSTHQILNGECCLVKRFVRA